MIGFAFQTQVQIMIGGVDATEQLASKLIEIRYDDEIAFKADNLEIDLADPQRLFIGEWAIQEGETITVNVIQQNKNYPGEQIVNNFGSFEIDEIEFQWGTGRGDVTVIRATSLSLNGNMRLELHDAHWENTTLQGIAQQICSKNNVTLKYTAPQNPTYATKDQVQESDISFLAGLCKREGLIMKSTNGTMTIADEKQMDAQAPVKTFTYGTEITSGRLRLSTADTYASAQVTSMNPTSGEKVEGNFDEDEGDPDPDSAYDEGNPQKTTLFINEYPSYASSDTPQDDLNA